jgi:flagellar biosynthesis anti-sigma factor FlgM
VSARSRELSLQANGEIDVAKVARLKSAIESGTFKIDPREIAERIVRGG